MLKDKEKDKCGLQGLLISDFNVDILKGYLNNVMSAPALSVDCAPFGQVWPLLLDAHHACWCPGKSDESFRYDFAVIWTQPENVIKSFGEILQYKKVDIGLILDEIREYGHALRLIKDKVKHVFIPTWTLPSYVRGYGWMDNKVNIGFTDVLARMNICLADQLADDAQYTVLNVQNWFNQVGESPFSSKLWYMAKSPFAQQLYQIAAREINHVLDMMSGGNRKLVIVDLDDTLWGGIVGEDGWQNIKLGGHDPVGEAHMDFQKALKALMNRGIVLGIVSKNEEAVAINAIEQHPDMILRRDDFAAWRINWNDKAKNIIEVTQELNLGLDAVVFIDDHPLERARVKEALPEVFVPEWPKDKLLYKQTLLELNCFDAWHMTSEDGQRSRMYGDERKRKQTTENVTSIDEWVKTLGIRVTCEMLNDVNLERSTQLFNKTNQMNLSTRRLSANEISQWCDDECRKMWTFRVADKFGDSGLTGILSLELADSRAVIVDFILSCRVFGRKIEDTMMYVARSYAQSKGCSRLSALYHPTAGNAPCLQFLKHSGFDCMQDENYVWKLDGDNLAPQGVHIEGFQCEQSLSVKV